MQGVPGHYIKTAPVDWKLEFLSSAGGSLRMGEAVLPAASFGVWAMLELIDCDFVHPHKEPTAGGAIVAAYLAAMGPRAIQQAATMTQDEIEPIAWLWGAENEVAPDDLVALRDWLNIAFCGFGMIPSSSGGSEQIFGMDSFGSIAAAIGADLGKSYDELLWGVPLSMVGHAIAQKSKQEGAKGIARPKDPQHIQEQFDETRRRHDAGLLYEWQEREPLQYGLDGHESEDEAYRYAVLQHEARMKRKGAA